MLKWACWLSVPGTSHPFVVVLGVHGQNGDPRADVDQQHGEGVVQGAGRLHAALGVRGVLEIVAFRVSVEAHPVNVQEAVDQAVQLVQLQQLQVSHLQDTQRELFLYSCHHGSGVLPADANPMRTPPKSSTSDSDYVRV